MVLPPTWFLVPALVRHATSIGLARNVSTPWFLHLWVLRAVFLSYFVLSLVTVLTPIRSCCLPSSNLFFSPPSWSNRILSWLIHISASFCFVVCEPFQRLPHSLRFDSFDIYYGPSFRFVDICLLCMADSVFVEWVWGFIMLLVISPSSSLYICRLLCCILCLWLYSTWYPIPLYSAWLSLHSSVDVLDVFILPPFNLDWWETVCFSWNVLAIESDQFRCVVCLRFSFPAMLTLLYHLLMCSLVRTIY